jgi:uncharacterized membrane protein
MKSISQKRKYDMTMLYEFILLVAVIVIVSLLVFQVNGDARDDLTKDSVAYNATLDADTAVAKIPKSLKLLGTAVVFGAVLWVILRVIPMRGSSSTFQ